MSSWFLIPSVLVPLIIVGAVASRFLGAGNKRGYTGKYDPKTGLGRGAPGFQTGVKRVAVTPEIAARMRAGEQVSAEEIEASIARAQSQSQASSSAVRNPNVDQDWLPQAGRSPAGKKNKKR
ncbi:uncharacterized protein PAN0_003c1983 [Moesziomyces antarcticus]|uniref:Uncharacterized protein n=1 Tax=Pseudozyma antarctica TaxID=84753 RepID=A0A5C3FJ55_PSEA2|nr:uncharacterized protein PAN0_003c1983 [Moesziomyces antarcticus]GAK63775.1 conserved hypothetical protein [Moesziomyces antarcticus]SPO44378.1 uncharacterized protein PSANT_02063 [Moesziomyces antarcticus]